MKSYSKQIFRQLSISATLLAFGCLLAASAFAASDSDTSLTLGEVAGLPNTQVMVPLYLTPNPATVKIGHISGSITFENKSVTFLKAEKGIVLQGVNGNFEVKMGADPANPTVSMLNFDVTSGSGERLREGVLLFLTFSINVNAPEDVDITLQLQKVKINEVDKPTSILALNSKNGTIDVIKPEEVPYTSCFFFSH